MKSFPVLIAALIAASACTPSTPPSRTISGRLSSTFPSQTSALAIGSTQRVAVPVNADGTFVLKVRADESFVVKFVAARKVVGSVVRPDHRLLAIRRGLGSVALGAVGSSSQALTAAPTAAADCSGTGEELAAEEAGNVEAADDAETGGDDGESNDDGAAESDGEHQDVGGALENSDDSSVDQCGETEDAAD